MFAGVATGGIVGGDAATDLDTIDAADAGSVPLDISGATGGKIDPLDIMARLARILDEQNVPEEGRYFVAPPWFYEQLSQSSSKLMSVDFNGGQGSIRNGLVSSGKLRGFSTTMFFSIAWSSSAEGLCSQDRSAQRNKK